VIVGLEGIALSPDATLGIAAAVVGAASYGVALTYIRRRMAPQPPLHLAFGQLVLGAVMLLPLAAVSAPDLEVTGEAVAAILGIGLLSTAIAWPLLFRLNRDVGPLATSTVTFLNPVFGTLWGAVFLAEAVSAGVLAGAALVFVSLALILDLRLPVRGAPSSATGRGDTPTVAAAEPRSP
jgi:drug/metabolite transporter (DMT)-like permease